MTAPLRFLPLVLLALASPGLRAADATQDTVVTPIT